MRFFDIFTGDAVKNKVDEYTEVYGEVLLGLHRDLQQQVDRFEKLLNQSHTQLATQQRQIEQLRLLCVISYVFALIVGVAVWLLR